MLRKIETPFKLVLVYILMLLFLAGDDILQATYSIAEQVKDVRNSYRLANDALEAIRLDINKYRHCSAGRPIKVKGPGMPEGRSLKASVTSKRRFGSYGKRRPRTVSRPPTNRRRGSYLSEDIYSVTDQAYSADSRRRLDDVLESRLSIVNLAAAFSKWNDSNFETEQKDDWTFPWQFRTEIITILALIGLLGAAAGGAALYRIIGIEKSNQQAHAKVTKAQDELKRLSHQLVSAQEEERKALSRELHDEIGQSLTALKFELANTEKIARAEGSTVMRTCKTCAKLRTKRCARVKIFPWAFARPCWMTWGWCRR